MSIPKKIVFLLLIPLLAFSVHKYYLSSTQIEYNQEQKSLEVIINVFMDDIENTVNKKFKVDLQLTTEKELKNSDSYFSNYLNEKLNFKINNKNYKFNYLGKEYDGDLVYFYLEITNIENISSIEINSQILTEEFEDQQNVIRLKVNGKKISKILTKKNDKALLNF